MPAPEVSFFTKGERYAHDGGYIIVNQSYVQHIPALLSANRGRGSVAPETASEEARLPLLFIHGGGLTGAVWESTPDRRPGWAIIASRPPYDYPVYLLDAVDSGRSQPCPDILRSDGTVEHRKASEVWQRFRLGTPDGFETGRRELHPGCRFPAHAFDALVSTQTARRWGREQNIAEANGIADTIKEIGPCHVIAHSNGGAMFCLALSRHAEISELVRSVVLVEPGHPAEGAVKVGVKKVLFVWGDFLEMPEYRRVRGILEQYTGNNPHTQTWELPQMGITGNTHFPMCDLNSDEIVKLILNWIASP